MPSLESVKLKTRLPAYAEGMLHTGKFAEHIVLRWGNDNGPILGVWAAGQTPAWNGTIHVGGFVERLHALELGGVELVIAEIVGGAFPTVQTALATLDEMKQGIFSHPNDAEPIGEHLVYPFVLDPESHFAGLLQDALVAGLAVDAVGRLADDKQGLQVLTGLPLVMEALTLLR
jgi:hypothetical protein